MIDVMGQNVCQLNWGRSDRISHGIDNCTPYAVHDDILSPYYTLSACPTGSDMHNSSGM